MAKTKADKTKAELEEMLASDSDDSPENEVNRLDETVPGGRYKRGNEIVNAEGEKVK